MASRTRRTTLSMDGVAEFKAEPLNPFLYTDYASCNYLKDLELDFHRQVLTTGRRVTPDVRSKLVNLLVQTHKAFQFQQESLYLALDIIDRFLRSQDAPLEDLTLICLASLHLASKFDKSSRPLVRFSYVFCKSDGAVPMLRVMEDKILGALSLHQCPPLAVHFLYHFIRVRGTDDSIRAMAEFFLELSFYDPELSSLSPSLLAASVLVLSLRLSNLVPWSSSLATYAGYSMTTLHTVIVKVAKNTLKAKRSPNQEVIKKYSAQNLYLVSRRVYEVRQKKNNLVQIADGQ